MKEQNFYFLYIYKRTLLLLDPLKRGVTVLYMEFGAEPRRC